MRYFKVLFSILLSLYLFGCSENTVVSQEVKEQEVEEDNLEIQLYINDEKVPVIWEENGSVAQLKSILSKEKMEIKMHPYGGFEQVGSLGQNLISQDSQIHSQAGDIFLYSSNNIVIFYGSNSWEYTRLGRIDLEEEQIVELLKDKEVTIVLDCSQ